MPLHLLLSNQSPVALQQLTETKLETPRQPGRRKNNRYKKTADHRAAASKTHQEKTPDALTQIILCPPEPSLDNAGASMRKGVE